MDDILDVMNNEPHEGEVLENDYANHLEHVEMDREQALEITEAIRSAATATFLLLKEAHQRKAHKALGYKTWAEYVKQEFDVSPQRSYQLVDFAKAVEMIEAATPEGTKIKLTEAQARDLKRELPKITEEIEQETKDLTPEEAAERANELINERRAQIKEEQGNGEFTTLTKDEVGELNNNPMKHGKNYDDETFKDDGLNQNDFQNTPENNDPHGFENDIPLGADEVGLSQQDVLHLYNFFKMLDMISELPDPEDFTSIVPEGREKEVDDKLLQVTTWINRFQSLWEIR